ncbi:MAG: regulatory iron-sulfur-containing complex subunit RicT [Bacteroidota bacterium]
MGCGNCGSGASGKPGGCKGNGGCSTGGCNRLNVYDWLNALPLSDSAKPYPVIEVSFNLGSRKDFFRNNTSFIVEKGDWLAVEGVGGFDVGQVSLTGELVKLQLKKYGVAEHTVTKRVLHKATDEELDMCARKKDREADVLIRSRAIARSLNLDMKLCEVEIQADSKKGTFFYTADQRVDFRELIKAYAGDFKMKVEMKQIGARQESGKVGGIGSCGRELCCSTWLTDFKSVNTTAARYQNLSINQTKLSGQCGRLKCCLNYELDTYMDALSVFPDAAERLETVKGIAHLAKRDIFKNLMWYTYSDNSKQYPLSIDRVKEIQKLNKAGQKADELQPVELETRDSKAGIKADMGFVNDVGQITLKALEKGKKGKKKPVGKAPGQQQGGTKPQLSESGGQPGANPNRQQGTKSAQSPSGNNRQGNRPQQGGGAKPENRQGNRPQRPQRPADGSQPQQDAEGVQPQAEGSSEQLKPQQGEGGMPQRNRDRPNRPQRDKPQQGAEGTQPQGEGAEQQPGEGGKQPHQRNRDRPNRPQQQKPQQGSEGAQPQGEGGEQQPGEGGKQPQQRNRDRPNRPQQQRDPNANPGEQRPERPQGNRPHGGQGRGNRPQGNRPERPNTGDQPKANDQPPATE